MQRRTTAHHRAAPPQPRGGRPALAGERRLEPISTGLGAHAPPLNFQTEALHVRLREIAPERPHCDDFAIACAASAIDGGQERSGSVMSKRAWGHGSLTPSMQIRGACATRSSGAAGSIRPKPLKPGRPLVAVAPALTIAAGYQNFLDRVQFFRRGPGAASETPILPATGGGWEDACRETKI
jgi:hypothetical protein